jgi:hypothetical protein
MPVITCGDVFRLHLAYKVYIQAVVSFSFKPPSCHGSRIKQGDELQPPIAPFFPLIVSSYYSSSLRWKILELE